MPIAIDPKATVDYILESDRACDHPTIFKLKPLTGSEWLRLLARHSKGAEVAPDFVVSLAEACVVGWSDFLDARGKPVPFKRGDLSALSPAHIGELGAECMKMHRVTEADEKN